MTTTEQIPTRDGATPQVPHRMRAVSQERYGSPDALTVRDHQVPSPGPGEVLVQVHAAGVDRGVWHLVTGMPYLVRLAGFGVTRPKQPIPGMDVAGRVVAVGDGVHRLGIGDEVLGIGSGTYAEYAIASEEKLVRKPGDLSFAEAAALPISGIAAHQAVHAVGRVRAGQRVLVLGASGGVGSYAVQLARAAGAEVTGVCSAAKADLVRRLGAFQVVDYRSTDPTAGQVRYDVILDIGGRTPLRRLRRVLTRDGTLVIVGGEDGDRITGGIGRQLRALALTPFVRQRLTSFVSRESRDVIEWLIDAVEAGHLVAPVGASYRLEDVPTALADLTRGRLAGKAVIQAQPTA